MNKTILALFAVLITSFATNAQVIDGLPADSSIISFTNDSIANFIPDTAAIPLWQIGHSHKSFFGSDSAGTTIMTDTLNPYPVNANNWFVIKGVTLFTIVDFWHKYQTTNAHDGGVVEFSQDGGISWQNLKGDCNTDGTQNRGILTTNFYSLTDTLITGIPSFNGTCDSIMHSRFQFWGGWAIGPPMKSTTFCDFIWPYSFYVRFRFVSDSVVDSLAGWEIDSIKTHLDIYPSLVKTLNKLLPLNTYPNPSYDGFFNFPS